jgi:uncharacterized protein YfaQ (DUF2300 family)
VGERREAEMEGWTEGDAGMELRTVRRRLRTKTWDSPGCRHGEWRERRDGGARDDGWARDERPRWTAGVGAKLR